MIKFTTPIKDHLGDTGLKRSLGDQLTNRRCGVLGSPGFRFVISSFQARGCHQRMVARIINNLGVDMLIRAKHG
jgi:hypothetical protein